MRRCHDCYRLSPELFPWRRYSTVFRAMDDVELCEICIPGCTRIVQIGFADPAPCGAPQSPHSECGFCKEHELECAQDSLNMAEKDGDLEGVALAKADMAKLEMVAGGAR